MALACSRLSRVRLSAQAREAEVQDAQAREAEVQDKAEEEENFLGFAQLYMEGMIYAIVST